MHVIEPTPGRQLKWQDVNWTAATATVRRLQGRIFRAARNQEHAKVKNLQKLLVRSQAAKLLAIRQVTQQNRGRHTPGVDGVVILTPEARSQLLQEGLDLRGYRPEPVKRVRIPKGNGKTRPLGIPTVKDRVMQAIVKLALEPEWECRFEANSYGFRPGRNTMDAITAIHTSMSQRGCSQWVLDADISGCFDNISHDALLSRLPVFTNAIRRWLKAGVVEFGRRSESLAGTPQGGIISPLLANIALDGIERLFGAEDKRGNPVAPSERKGLNRGLNCIRYADDFVVTAPSREVIQEYVLPRLTAFLAERGLELSEAKTRIVHVDEGFDFLGFNVRRFKRKLLTRPAKGKVLEHLRSIKAYLKSHKQAPAAQVITRLNPVIRGWANYYRHGVSKETFSLADSRTWEMLWRWAKRRHPGKPAKWVKRRYFRDDWTFFQGKAHLVRRSRTPVTRYAKVKGTMSPLDPEQRNYWRDRQHRAVARQVFTKGRLTLLQRQEGLCGHCRTPFGVDDMNDLHTVRRHTGESNALTNQTLVHRWCFPTGRAPRPKA
jgi:RNA-directed DNA polymerase